MFVLEFILLSDFPPILSRPTKTGICVNSFLILIYKAMLIHSGYASSYCSLLVLSTFLAIFRFLV
jgi:hypothetical protein